MRAARRLGKGSVVTLLLLALGAALRFLASARGHNFDLESFRVVAEIVDRGGNVYAETSRYNYGPIWFHVLGLLDDFSRLFPDAELAFRLALIAVLTAVDVGIWAILRRHFGTVAAFVFFLSPVSIVITGYHNQFDNLAVLLALVAMVLYAAAFLPALLLLGLSLSVKHVFLVFPLWLAIRERGPGRKLLGLAVPLAVLVASFLPFLAGGRRGILDNVVFYHSFDNAPFWHAVLPGQLQSLVSPRGLLVGMLVVLGFAWRRRDRLDAALLYLLAVVVFAPAIANQYLAIALPAVAAFSNVFFLAFQVLAAWLLAVHPDGLHYAPLQEHTPRQLLFEHVGYRVYDPLIALLALGLVTTSFPSLRRLPRRAWSWLSSEARAQGRLLRGRDPQD